MNASQLTREGSQLWNPTSTELSRRAGALADSNKHANNFPPSRRCTEQFTGPAALNQSSGPEEGEEGEQAAGQMIDFTAPNVREQIAASVHEQQRQVHNPYSINRVYLNVDPETLAVEQRAQSDYFEQAAESLRQRNRERAPDIKTNNAANIIFMPPPPPFIESYDVFVKGGMSELEAEKTMTNMIYRWHQLCHANVLTYRNWFGKVHGVMSAVDPPNPVDFSDLADWCGEADRWWQATFEGHQALRHHSRSAAIAAGTAAPLSSSSVASSVGHRHPVVAPNGNPTASLQQHSNAGVSPSKRSTAVPMATGTQNVTGSGSGVAEAIGGVSSQQRNTGYGNVGGGVDGNPSYKK